MPEMETTTKAGGTTTTSRWWVGLLTPQTVVYIFAAFASLVIFWNTQKNHSQRLDTHDKELSLKADDADLKSLAERVNRQYETNNKILDRIIALEKQQEYEKGKAEGEREERRRQRNDNSGRTNN